MYTMKFDLPNLAKGVEIQITGLGIFENGKTYDITDEQAHAWRVAHTGQGAHYDEEGAIQLAPEDPGTLLEAFKNHSGITVKKATKGRKVKNEPETDPNIQEQLPLDQQENVDPEGGEQ